MGKIVLLMGKSTTGKDTVYKNLLEKHILDLKKVVLYTTRPMRDKEENGVQYYFCDEEGYQKFLNDRKIIEGRTYDTCYGPWRYFTVDDGTFDPAGKNVIAAAGTIPAYIRLRDHFGADNIVAVMIETDDGIRLERAMRREKKQAAPRYKEMCRRFITDSEDFDEEKLSAAGITNIFMNNNDLAECVDKVKEFIRQL